jgi:hypothetical protein
MKLNHWLALLLVLCAYLIGGYYDSLYASLAY